MEPASRRYVEMVRPNASPNTAQLNTRAPVRQERP
jgi:hypothetical protein